MRIGFQITDQQHEWVFGHGGGRHGQWLVTFVTDGGWQSQVIVPDSSYTPHNVAAAIAEQARNMDEIGGLQGAEVR